MHNYPLRIERIDPINRFNRLVSDPQGFDYFITKGGDNGGGVYYDEAQRIHKFGLNLKQRIKIELLDEFSLPDHTTANIYKIIKD